MEKRKDILGILKMKMNSVELQKPVIELTMELGLGFGSMPSQYYACHTQIFGYIYIYIYIYILCFFNLQNNNNLIFFQVLTFYCVSIRHGQCDISNLTQQGTSPQEKQRMKRCWWPGGVGLLIGLCPMALQSLPSQTQTRGNSSALEIAKKKKLNFLNTNITLAS